MQKMKIRSKAIQQPRKVLVQALAALTLSGALLPVSTAVRADEADKPGLLQRYTVNIQDLVIKGLEFVGVPYRRGGNTVESGLDCSGFTRLVFLDSNGIDLPRTAAEQAQLGTKVSADELKPGDLVFFNTMRRAFSHVGIYVGDNKFIHAPRTGSHVKIDDLSNSYWQNHFDGARRAPQLTTGTFRLPADLFSIGKDSARQD